MQSSIEKPIWRLVFRKTSFQNYLETRIRVDPKPLINYVHASTKEEANGHGFTMAEKIDHTFCYDETELITVEEIAC